MLEEFISVALEAFTNANGNADKFELELRRKLMVYNISNTPKVSNTQTIATPIEKIVSSITPDDSIFSELDNVDLNNMSDEEILSLAAKMGLLDNQQEQVNE